MEGTLGGTPINELPDASFAYVEPGKGTDDDGDTPDEFRHFPILDKAGKPDAAHVRNALARLASSPFEAEARPKVEAAAKELGIGTARAEEPLPTDLLRALAPTLLYADGAQLRALEYTPATGTDAGLGDLIGRFAVYDEWTEVNSVIEGHFMERTGEGTFKKTLAEKRPPIVFNHGWDPQAGTRPLAPTAELGEDTRGGYYGGPLLDTTFNRGELVPGLKANLYGSSYRGRPIQQDVVPRPKPSAYNPKGLPEVTLREAALKEFGPGMFPVYAGTSATVRSQTDDYFLSRFRDPEQIGAYLDVQRGPIALPQTEPTPVTPAAGAATVTYPSRFRSRDDWLDYLKGRSH